MKNRNEAIKFLLAGRESLKNKNYIDAETNFQSAIDSYKSIKTEERIEADKKNLTTACLNLSSVLIRNGKYDETLTFLTDNMSLLSLDKLHYNFGLAYFYKNDLANAAIAFEEAIKNGNDTAECHYNLGLVYKQGGNLAKALTEFQEAFQVNPDDHDISYNLGIIQLESNDLPSGIATLTTFIDKCTSISLKLNGYCKLIEAKLKNGEEITLKTREAWEYFKSLSKLDQDSNKTEGENIYINLLAILMANNSSPETQKLLKDIFYDSQEKLLSDLRNLALYKYDNGLEKEGFSMLFTLRELGDENATNHLSSICINRGNDELAQEILGNILLDFDNTLDKLAI